MNFVGIDYSLTCPCVCVTQDGTFINSNFYYLIDKKKYTGVFGNIQGDLHIEYKTDQERYENIALWAISKFSKLTNVKIMIEDYSFGSKGRVFNLAENCGLLKHFLYTGKYDFYTVPPTVVKKHATNKGNSNKDGMYDQFKSVTGIDLISKLSQTTKLGSPITDIVDAWYIARYLMQQEKI